MRGNVAFGVGRMGIGIVSWLAPQLAARIFGLRPDGEHGVVTQLFGARELALGALTATSTGPALQQVLRLNVAIDAADTVASVRQVRAGALSGQATLLVAAGAAAFTGIGATLLARGR